VMAFWIASCCSLTSLDPLSSMMGELDDDVRNAPANGECHIMRSIICDGICVLLLVPAWRHGGHEADKHPRRLRVNKCMSYAWCTHLPAHVNYPKLFKPCWCACCRRRHRHLHRPPQAAGPRGAVRRDLLLHGDPADGEREVRKEAHTDAGSDAL
jgi:hypothetical protein